MENKKRCERKFSLENVTSVHECFYCGHRVNRMRDHILKHSDEKPVMEYLNEKDKVRKRHMLDVITKKGDAKANKAYMETGIGKLIVGRITDPEADAIAYSPCTICKGFYMTSSLKKHEEKCEDIFVQLKETPEKLSREKTLLFFNQSGFHERCVVRLKGELGEIARNDKLIMMVGERLYKSRIYNRSFDVIVYKIKLLARLLKSYNKHNNEA